MMNTDRGCGLFRPEGAGARREASGRSLWLLPEPAAEADLAGWIEALARRLGSPAFGPHMTFLGGIPGRAGTLLAAAEPLAATLPPFRAAVLGAATTPAYFRALILDLRPPAGVASRRRQALETLAPGGERAWRPHLSLAYCDRPEAEKRRALAALGPEPPAEIAFDRLALVATAGPPEAWRRLGAFRLGG